MAQSGNGIDTAAVYQLLSEVAQTVRSHDEQFARLNGRIDGVERKLNELVGVVNGHVRRFDEVAVALNTQGRKLDDLAHGLTDLRDAVGHYHHSVVGQGIAVNRLEERVKLLEEHLGLGPVA